MSKVDKYYNEIYHLKRTQGKGVNHMANLVYLISNDSFLREVFKDDCIHDVAVEFVREYNFRQGKKKRKSSNTFREPMVKIDEVIDTIAEETSGIERVKFFNYQKSVNDVSWISVILVQKSFYDINRNIKIVLKCPKCNLIKSFCQDELQVLYNQNQDGERIEYPCEDCGTYLSFLFKQK